jgi:short-subunit dehydrogenase
MAESGSTGTGRPVALITGASSGIGAELARCFAQGGYDVVLTARRRDRLEALAAELAPHARVLEADLSDPDAPVRLYATTGPVDVLVNNAGLGALGRFATIPLGREMEMLRVNITALTELARLYVPPMVARGRGRVLNVASTAAFQPGPGMAVYGATKAYVLSLSEAMCAELAGSGVTVTCLCPGPTETEFAAAAGMEKSRMFRRAMPASQVAQLGFAATMAGRRLAIPGVMNRMSATMVRLAPRGLVLRIARKLLLG